VRIVRTDLTAEVSQQTFDRMKAERLAEAERIRARGREAARVSAPSPTAR
jgi:membrane protease subunit HflC